ncbi:MAG TPA: hypothetical protein VEI97_21320, partial [bacterium]|nr:hypothetical protein [bacterium]
LVQWAGGLTLVTASEGVIETFPGALESAQLGVGWEGGTGEVIVRFKGQLEWWVLQVRPGAL